MQLSFRRSIHLIAFSALVAATPGTARATDGHFLHGVGAINSALGGAGVAANSSLLGAFFVNPAGLASFSGTHLEMGFELMKPERSVSSSYGNMSGSTMSVSAFTPIPAFGWSTELSDGVVFGVAGLGIGGFGVDYAADPSNPMMMPRPYGFGSVYSNFQLMKIAPALAWKASDKLRLGVALNVDWASLAVDPMPTAAPAVDPGPDGVPRTADDRAYYSSAAHAGTAFGFGAQIGMQYQMNDKFSVGASYTSPQFFGDFSYNGVYEDPYLASYNTPRTFKFRMDAPAVYAAGLAYAPTTAVRTALDVKYMGYKSTKGFDQSGYNSDGSVKGFGWNDILVVAAGLEYDASPEWTLRGGYNYSGNPIPDALSMYNIPAPAIVQHHATVGVGYKLRPGVEINVAAYKAFENSISGPMQFPTGAVPGTTVKNTMSETSFLIGFSFVPTKR
ncbi:MAG: outer membrane protein transport protein [Gemmatimonadetes bacterium]|nr:outer membrane protein transport protein [Gemmatimonadota bacterium]